MSDPTDGSSSSQQSRTVTLRNRNGLHARPAHLFVQTANRFSSDLVVGRPGTDPVNGKSIMGIMMLAAEHGAQLELTASGADAPALLEALEALVESGFDED